MSRAGMVLARENNLEKHMDIFKPELPLPYVGVDPLLPERPQLLAFKAMAGIPDELNGHCYVVNLWLYAGSYAVGGNLGQMPAETLARVCRWTGDARVFAEAMVGAGFIVFDNASNVLVGGWDSKGGMVLKKRQEFRERKARSRAAQRDKHNAAAGPTTATITPSIPVPSPGGPWVGSHQPPPPGAMPAHRVVRTPVREVDDSQACSDDDSDSTKSSWEEDADPKPSWDDDIDPRPSWEDDEGP